MRRLWLPVCLTVLICSCAQYARPINTSADTRYSEVPVFFATNRNDTRDDNLNKRFGEYRSAPKYGIGTVAIPDDYPKAKQENYMRWNLILTRDPEEQPAVLDISRYKSTEHFRQINQQLQESTDKTLLFFIHGFNVPFERIIRISAKLAYDLEIDGAVSFFSWPSEHNATRYSADEGHLLWAQSDINWYVDQLFRQTSAEQIIFMAHSMGSRAMVNAIIEQFENHPEDIARSAALVFMAPDIDATVFSRDYAPQLTDFGIPVSLYVSSDDIALSVSRVLHRYPRAGEAGPDIVIVPGIDTIDATDSDADFLGHEYYFQGAQTIMDLYLWLAEGMPPELRGLEPVETERGTYWKIVPAPNADSPEP